MQTKDPIYPRLYETLSTHAGFSRDENEFYFSLLKKELIKKKEHYLKAGEIFRAIAYVTIGCFRQYVTGEQAKEIIIQFALEDWWIGDLESFQLEKPSSCFIQALEECGLVLISRENFLRACNALVVPAIGVVYCWNNSLLGYWINFAATSVTDIGFILFIIVPRHLPLKLGIPGPLLWMLAVIFSTIEILSYHP